MPAELRPAEAARPDVARRCLPTLCHHGCAESDGRRFRLAPRVLRPGLRDLAQMLRPPL